MENVLFGYQKRPTRFERFDVVIISGEIVDKPGNSDVIVFIVIIIVCVAGPG